MHNSDHLFLKGPRLSKRITKQRKIKFPIVPREYLKLEMKKCSIARQYETGGVSYGFRLSISECHVLSVRFLSVWQEWRRLLDADVDQYWALGEHHINSGMRGSGGPAAPEHSSIFRAAGKDAVAVQSGQSISLRGRTALCGLQIIQVWPLEGARLPLSKLHPAHPPLLFCANKNIIFNLKKNKK